MFNNLKNRKLRSKWQVDLALHQAFEVAGPDAHAFQRLVLHVQHHTEMLRTLPAGGYAGYAPPQTFVGGLSALTAHHQSWRRDVETWKPANGSAWSQFGSLANHLFSKNPVPSFMTSAWVEGRSAEARRHQKWFKHLAFGYGIQGVATPIHLTRIMERYFLEAPHHCSVNQAVRWSQIRGLGSDTALADAIVATRLGQRFDHEEYWSLVIRFLIDNPDLGTSNIGSVVEFLHFNRQLCRLRPFCKRSKRNFAEEFLRQVENWRAQHSTSSRRASIAWKQSGIGEFEYRVELRAWDSALWRIQELLDSNQLLEEGRRMRHCVARYSHKCASGLSTIWSLTCSDARSQCRRELTIEVNPKSRTIVQAKGIGNSKPRPEARRVMLLWAKERELDAERWI